MDAEIATLNIYSLIKEAYPTFEFDVSTTRVYFNQHPSMENDYQVASFFDLNPLNGQLTLKKKMKQQIVNQGALTMKQGLTLVFLSQSYSFASQKVTLNLDLKLPESQKAFEKITYAINYEDLLDKNSKSLYKFGRISENITKTRKFYLETTKMVVTETKTYDLILANTINLSNSYNSIIYLDIKSGDLYLNRTLFFELNLVGYDFIVLEYNDVESRLLSRIEAKLTLKFNQYINFIDYFMNFRKNPLIIDRFIDSRVIKLGESVFKLSDLFSNFFEFDPYHQMKIELDNTDESQRERNTSTELLPFKLNPTNGALILADNLEANQVYKFSLALIDSFSVYFRFSTTSNNIIQFEHTSYEININASAFDLDTSSSLILLKLNANYTKESSAKSARIIYRFYDSSSSSSSNNTNTNMYTLVSLFKSMFNLNELSGEMQLNANQKKKFTDFCSSFESLDTPNLFLTVKAFSQV
jgi:hypothetical protein